MYDGDMIDKALKGMLARIFSDGRVDDAERAELRARLASGALAPAVAQETMRDFLATTYKHATADGKLSDAERGRLRTIVTELDLPNDCVPDEVKRAIR